MDKTPTNNKRFPIYSLGIEKRLSLAWTLLAATAAIAVRLPFLLKAEGFFNSDEAVEGLMALHLEDLPVFFWGQGYKGIPEVYLMAGAFALFGVGVVPLKAVTLGLWAVAVAFTVRLAFAWHGGLVAAITAALVIVAPPSMVAWSLSGNAEVTWLTGLVAALALLAWPGRAEEAGGASSAAASAPVHPRRPLPLAVYGLSGMMMWIHPVASCAIAALAATRILGSAWWSDPSGRVAVATEVVLARNARGLHRAVLLTLHAAAAVIAVLFLFTYAGGAVQIGPLSATHPQRSLRPLMLVGFLLLVGHAFTGRFMPRRRAAAALLSFLAGLAPVLFHAARGGGVGTSVVTRHLSDAPWMLQGIVTEILPVFLGLTDHDGIPLHLPWWSVAPLLAAAATALLVALARRGSHHPAQVYPWMVGLVVLGLLIVGGAFGGPQTSRYLLPFFGLFAITVASGLARLAGGRALVAAALTAVCVSVFVVGQARWYARLHIDPSAREIASCLESHGHRFARANFWIAYRMTFLAGERVIVIPDDARDDRYPPYLRAVENAGAVPLVQTRVGPPGGRSSARPRRCARSQPLP